MQSEGTAGRQGPGPIPKCSNCKSGSPLKKQDKIPFPSSVLSFDLLRHPQTEDERLGKHYHSHGLCKQAGVSILTSDTVDFKPKLDGMKKDISHCLRESYINKT